MKIQHFAQDCRFVAEVDGFTAYVEYELVGNGLDIVHTVVPQEIGGRGIASELVRVAYDYAKAQGLQCFATCSYAERWLERHHNG